MSDVIIRSGSIEAFVKLEALDAALAGEFLTDKQERALRAVMEDLRPLVIIGNRKPITKTDVIEGFRLLIGEVPLMTGERRRQTVELLHRIQARGFENKADLGSIPHLMNEHLAEKMRVEVDEVEIAEAVEGTEL